MERNKHWLKPITIFWIDKIYTCPISVVPMLYRHGNPSECVIFTEPDPFILPPDPYYSGYNPYLRLRKNLGRKTSSKRSTRPRMKKSRPAAASALLQRAHGVMKRWMCRCTVPSKNYQENSFELQRYVFKKFKFSSSFFQVLSCAGIEPRLIFV